MFVWWVGHTGFRVVSVLVWLRGLDPGRPPKRGNRETTYSASPVPSKVYRNLIGDCMGSKSLPQILLWIHSLAGSYAAKQGKLAVKTLN